MVKLTDKKKHLRCDVAFFAMLAVLATFMIWKAPYGYAGADEGFYLTIPYRLTQGDSLLSDEWHVSQLSALLLYPIMLIYRMLGGNSDGIILIFRYIYIAVQVLCTMLIYFDLRGDDGEHSLGALCAAAVFMPYAPFFIMALSYNSMGIMTLTLSGISVATAKEKNVKIWRGGYCTHLQYSVAHI